MPRKNPLFRLVISAELNHLDFTVANSRFAALLIMVFLPQPKTSTLIRPSTNMKFQPAFRIR